MDSCFHERMKRCLHFIALSVLTAQPVLAKEDSLAGTWRQWNPRTVIGTGETDTELNIQGEKGHHWLEYTFGRINRIRKGERLILKKTTTTYQSLKLVKTDTGYSFTLPEDERTVHLERKTLEGRDALVISREEGKDIRKNRDQQPFFRVDPGLKRGNQGAGP